MLQQPRPDHPEFLAMAEVIEQRRLIKMNHARELFGYKLRALQTKSMAERAQLHGQYMQDVRDARDKELEEANKEWYLIQRERRHCDEEEPSFLYQHTTRRSQQIVRQANYNMEVSVLAGFAKYKGFPAAPEIKGAKISEVDEDMRSMGVSVPQSEYLFAAKLSL